MKHFVLPWLCLLLGPLNAFTTPSQQQIYYHGRRRGDFSLYADQSSSSSSSAQPIVVTTSVAQKKTTRRARALIQSLIEEDGCYATIAGARAFANVCAVNVVYEDRFEPQPICGKQNVEQHLTKHLKTVRIDQMSDGDVACGFAWTWIDRQSNQEGLRGTTFVQLNEQGEIQYVQEIPEPIFKPGNMTKDLLKAITADEEWKPFQPFEPQTPTTAHELVKYLFIDLQKAEPKQATDELMRFMDDTVVYRDFNYPNVFSGPDQVRAFCESFRFPGLEFRPLRFDDGIDSTCFTWEIVLGDAPDTIQGISLYQLDPVTRKIVYVRDVPESAIKPPILGKLARQLRPKLGTFETFVLGSRRDGL